MSEPDSPPVFQDDVQDDTFRSFSISTSGFATHPNKCRHFETEGLTWQHLQYEGFPEKTQKFHRNTGKSLQFSTS